MILNIHCKKKALAIGDNYEGGVIAYILQNGDPGYDAKVQHGLIAAPNDQSNGIKWYNGSYVVTGASGDAIGSGNANTIAIVGSQGIGNYAAKLCYDLELGGYSDWYLPSIGEINKLFENKIKIGGFADSDYWSSSEVDDSRVQDKEFSNIHQTNWTDTKEHIHFVRAIRAF